MGIAYYYYIIRFVFGARLRDIISMSVPNAIKKTEKKRNARVYVMIQNEEEDDM